MRILTVLTSLAVIATGVWCVAYPGAVFPSMAFVLGCVMISAGVIMCGAYFFGPAKKDGFGWLLAEGLLMIILGGVVLSNQLVIDATIPLVFGMWTLYGGVGRLVLALARGRVRDRVWMWMLVLGILSTLGGMYPFFNQILFSLPMMPVIGICFLLQGLNILASAIIMPARRRKKVDTEAVD